MKHLLIAILSVLMIMACNEKPKEIVEDDIPKEEEQQPPKPQPCFDSTYFDTTLPMEEHDLIYFTVMLPEGGFSKTGKVGIEAQPGGWFGYGCDTFTFEYGVFVTNADDKKPTEHTIHFEKQKRDDHLMAIDESEFENGVNHMEITLTKTDTQQVRTWTTDYKYDYYMDEVIETIELK